MTPVHDAHVRRPNFQDCSDREDYPHLVATASGFLAVASFEQRHGGLPPTNGAVKRPNGEITMSINTLTVRAKLTVAFGFLAGLVLLVSALAVQALSESNGR